LDLRDNPRLLIFVNSSIRYKALFGSLARHYAFRHSIAAHAANHDTETTNGFAPVDGPAFAGRFQGRAGFSVTVFDAGLPQVSAPSHVDVEP
jgi:hypothetical protein